MLFRSTEKIRSLNPKVLFVHYDYFMANKETTRDCFQHIPFIIFISHIGGNVLTLIHNGAFDFINFKTATETEIALVLARLKAAISERENRKKISKIYSFIEFNKKHRFKTKNGYSLIPHKDILSVESKGITCLVHLANTKSIAVNSKIGKLADELPEDIFFRISRSIIINIRYISRINTSNGTVTLEYNDIMKNYKIPAKISGSKLLQLSKIDA